MADIQIVGTIGRIDDLKYTNSGKAVLSISVAEDHNRRQNGEWVKEGTTWWRVTAWERQAEAIDAQRLEKGTRVVVIGTVRSREWEKDGEQRTSYDVTARHIAVIPKAPQATYSQPQAAPTDDPWATHQPTDEPPF